jgi:hypothetical protein
MTLSCDIFQDRYLTQAAQMPFGLAVLCREVSLDQIPSDFGPHGPSAHAENVHMIVLDSLLGRVALFAHGHVLRVLVVRWIGLPAGAESTSCSIRALCACWAITAKFPP